MKGNTILTITRLLCLTLLINTVHFLELSSVTAPNETKPRMVFAFSTRKICFTKRVRERPNPFLSISIGNCIGDEYSGARNLSLKAQRIAVIGGGLAGLSTVYHILEKSPSSDVTIIDPRSPGTGGASAVAGGLLHPLSPKGKLAYRGMEGLASANKLIQAASKYEDNVVLQNKIYRIATKEAQATVFQDTAAKLPEIATWIEPVNYATGENDNEDDFEKKYFNKEKNVQGALRLSGGCKVVHMQSYLKGLWSHCEAIGSGKKEWINYDDIDIDIDISKNSQLKEHLSVYDCVVLAAGSGLFQSSTLTQEEFPIQLVRGQSIEMTMDDFHFSSNAILCGKYVSPLKEEGRVVIGR